VKAWLKGCITDTLGRPEPKMALGIIAVIAAIGYGLWAALINNKPDWPGFLAISGVGTALMGASAVMDDRNDGRPSRGGGP
jgi:hypothetical protein